MEALMHYTKTCNVAMVLSKLNDKLGLFMRFLDWNCIFKISTYAERREWSVWFCANLDKDERQESILSASVLRLEIN